MSLLPFENPGDRADELFPERPAPPGFQRDFAAVQQVCVDVFRQAGVHPSSRNATLTSSLCSNDRLSRLVDADVNRHADYRPWIV
jgi:hypothetical protein